MLWDALLEHSSCTCFCLFVLFWGSLNLQPPSELQGQLSLCSGMKPVIAEDQVNG